MKKTSFLALLGKKFPEKLSGLSLRGGGGYPPFPLMGEVNNFCYDFTPINCAKGSGFSTDYLQGLPVHHHARVQGRGGDGRSNLDEKENPGGRGRGGGGETEKKIEGLKLRKHVL